FSGQRIPQPENSAPKSFDWENSAWDDCVGLPEPKRCVDARGGPGVGPRESAVYRQNTAVAGRSGIAGKRTTVSANDLLVFAEALHSPQSVFSPRSARLVRAMGSLNESEDHATVGKEAK
ncbi:MAG: hypothetical protein ACK5EA_28345, partial [Planctomycetaceae bacterium]